MQIPNTNTKSDGGESNAMLWLKRTRLTVLAIISLMLTASCAGGGANAGGNQMEYKEAKTMVLDILKTDEAKKVIQKASKTEDPTQMKLLSSGDGPSIQMAVKDVLTQTDQAQLIQQLATDPKFAGEFAKAADKQLKQIHKELIKDPQYQKSMIDVMKNPDYQKIIADTMKATEYRQEVMTIIQDALQSPLYKAELINLMKKALEENAQQQKTKAQSKDQEKKKEESSSKGQESGGGGDKQSGSEEDKKKEEEK
jgi:spore germination protein D